MGARRIQASHLVKRPTTAHRRTLQAAWQRTALLTYGHADEGELIDERIFPFN